MTVLRLRPAGAAVLERLLEADRRRSAGDTSAGTGRLARRLTDAGLAAPLIPPAASASPLEGVTVVIPVRDRPSGLQATLEAVARSRPAPAAVVVVDDASADPSGTRAAAHRSGATVVQRPRRGGPAAARNTGWRAAGAPIVVFVDADCLPDPGWLGVLIPHFDDPTLAAVAPRVPAVAGPGLARYEAARSPLDLGARPSPVRPGSAVPYVPSAALAVRREALEALGGFDEALPFGEDVDLVWRLVAAGWRVRYEPAARVYHPARAGLPAWLGQRRDYGTSAAPLAARHGSLVAPLILGRASAAAWAATVTGPWWLAAVGTGATLARSVRHLGADTGLPRAEALRVGVVGHALGGKALAEATRRTWWPAMLVVLAAGAAGNRRCLARSFRVAAWLTAPLLVEWWQAGRPLDPLSWCALRAADDIAYGTGVWTGVARARSVRALLPKGPQPRRRPSSAKRTNEPGASWAARSRSASTTTATTG